jgi:hypothetical protein
LLVGRDADQADAIRERVERLRDDTNGRSVSDGALAVQVVVDHPAPLREREAHEPPDVERLEDSGAGPRFDAGDGPPHA